MCALGSDESNYSRCCLLSRFEATNDDWQSGALLKLKSYTGSPKVAQIVPKNIISQIQALHSHCATCLNHVMVFDLSIP